MIDQEKIAFSQQGTAAPHADNPEPDRWVLLVEDDASLRRYLEVILEKAGYKVIAAADGLAAMKIALTCAIDIVITDAMMPKLDGYELCRFIRSNPRFNHLPIILLSALVRNEAEREAQLADAFISKPVSAEHLIEVVERLLVRQND